MIEELKPCPFCGGKAEIAFSGDPWKGGYIVARCKTCRAAAGSQYYRGEPIEIDLEETIGAEYAAEAWNRRVNEKARGGNR